MHRISMRDLLSRSLFFILIAFSAIDSRATEPPLNLLVKLAQRGDPEAQCWLAKYYEKLSSTKGKSTHSYEAINWYLKAAKQGYAEAQYRLGKIQDDPKEAAAWLKKAAEQGHPQAEGLLGMCYAHGHGVSKNFDMAILYFKKAAAHGDWVGQSFCGGHYYAQKNFYEAFRWTHKVHEQLPQDENIRKFLEKLVKEISIEPISKVLALVCL